MATKGYAAPEVEHAYARARELCQQIGETPQLFPILWGLWVFYYVRAELQTARELAEQFLALAQRAARPGPLRRRPTGRWGQPAYPGRIVSAHAHLEQGIALYDPQQHRCPGCALRA